MLSPVMVDSVLEQRGARAAAPRPVRRWRAPWSRLSYRMGLVLSVSALVILTGAMLTTLAFRSSRSSTSALAGALFQEVSNHAITKTRAFVLRAVPVAKSLVNLADLGLARDDPDRLARQLTAVLEANPGVTWVSYSDEAGAFTGAYRTAEGQMRINRSRIVQGKTALQEHDVLPDGTWRLVRQESDSGYDPRQRPFYQRAKEAGKLVWLPPYIFYEQGVPGITCADPVYDRSGRLTGVFTVDFDLNTMSAFTSELSISPGSRLFVMTADGALLALPKQMQVVHGQRDKGTLPTVHDADDPLLNQFRAQLAPEDLSATGGSDHARQFEFEHEGTRYLARATAFSIDEGLSWVVGAVAPESDFLGGVRRSNAMLLSLSLASLVAAVIVAILLAQRVSGPIVALAASMRRIGSGDLAPCAELGGAREFRQLSRALNQMLTDLRDRMRLRTSMAVAMEVQQKLLPAESPRVRGLDIAGFSAYCDETGGDYFDYIGVDRPGARGLLVAIGDVMGHGIAAALLMASARAIVHSRASAGGNLADLLGHLNEILVADMMGSRFMTMHLWMVDPEHGTVRWASAGHDPAIIYDAASDSFEELVCEDLPLGIEPHIQFHQCTYGPLRRGQIIVLGTDGVWEMPDATGDRFGKERLHQSIREAAGGNAWEIAAAVSRDLNAFRGAERQRDDVTLVIIKVTQDPAPACAEPDQRSVTPVTQESVR